MGVKSTCWHLSDAATAHEALGFGFLKTPCEPLLDAGAWSEPRRLPEQPNLGESNSIL